MDTAGKVLLLALFLFVVLAEAAPRDRDMKRGKGNRRGNERSERVHRLQTGQTHYAGNGCPAGTMQVVFAPDFLSFTVILDRFIAESLGTNGQRRDVMNCTATVPIQIPTGMQMEITRVDFRGFVGLPARANASLVSTFNFAGRRGDHDKMNLRYQFQGPVMDNYEISSDILNQSGRTPDSEVSPCGGEARLRIVNRLQVTNRAKNEQATVTLDSIDGAAHAIYQVNWRTCR